MQKASRELLQMLTRILKQTRDPSSEGSRPSLILARNARETVELMKKADLCLLHSPALTRFSYEGDEGLRSDFCYCLEVPLDAPQSEPNEVWIANLQRATPVDMLLFRERWHTIYWPDMLGVYAAVTWDQWDAAWERFHRGLTFNRPQYRPEGVSSHVTFSVGILEEWVPKKVTVWQQLRRNLEELGT